MDGVIKGEQSSNTQIELLWIAQTTPSATGGSSIISYSLEWNQGSSINSWVALVGAISDYTGTSYIVSSGVSQGETYTFRIRSKNRWGWSTDYSTTTSIIAAKPPTSVSAPTTTVSGSDVVVNWSSSFDNGGLPVTEYTVKI
jgi:hypothetical protein